jgi:predicted nucleotidyltransferase
MKDKTLVERDEEITKKIGEVLTRFHEIEFAYLFGSFLESDAFNDVDVALHVSKDFSPYNGLKFSLMVERAIEKEIEPRYKFDAKI